VPSAPLETARQRGRGNVSNVKRARTQRIFRERAAVLPTTLALGYALGGYALAFVLLARGGLAGSVLGVLLAAHSMFIAAYLLHEALHQSLFAARSANRAAGELLSFVASGAYASYERMRRLHLRHHHERADVSCFDYQSFLRRRPRWVRALVLGLEWAYVPAVEVLMHLQVIVRPFLVASERRHLPRVALMLLLRGGLLALLATVAPQAVLLYFLAYGLLLTALCFFDAFHHTYQQYFIAADAALPVAVQSHAYEQTNTYSNLIALRPAWLNLLCLNFGYHNAHHERAGIPWYRLPALHRELFSAQPLSTQPVSAQPLSTQPPQLLPVRELLVTFHRNRVRRVLCEDYGQLGTGAGRADGFVGAHGVSFLSVV
jgi:fatty acid desaturase